MTTQQPIAVCLPVCSKDTLLLARNLEWQHELGTSWDLAVITHDATVGDGWLKVLTDLARKCYDKVETHLYPDMPRRYWPPNWAWQHSARKMQSYNRPWLWVEADMIPLNREWLNVLADEYATCGKQFFCPVVKGMGHANGTGIYPADTPDILKNTMRETKGAWDVVMRPEMIKLNFDASRTIQHAWSMIDGQLHQYQHGDKPTFKDAESLDMLLPTAVMFHRVCDGSLIERLRERMNEKNNHNVRHVQA